MCLSKIKHIIKIIDYYTVFTSLQYRYISHSTVDDSVVIAIDHVQIHIIYAKTKKNTDMHIIRLLFWQETCTTCICWLLFKGNWFTSATNDSVCNKRHSI